jgi:hypothetical protein
MRTAILYECHPDRRLSAIYKKIDPRHLFNKQMIPFI